MELVTGKTLKKFKNGYILMMEKGNNRKGGYKAREGQRKVRGKRGNKGKIRQSYDLYRYKYTLSVKYPLNGLILGLYKRILKGDER